MLALQPYFVGHLINQNEKAWNEQLVRQIFASETAQDILYTHLHQQVQVGKLVWKAEKNGCYSVRSV